MNKKRIELIIAVALIFVFLGLSVTTYSKYLRPVLQGMPLSQKPETGEAKLAEAKTPKAQAAQKKLTWGRDPFKLVKTKAKAYIRDLILNVIIWDQDNPYAIINGEVVVSGDNIQGNLVVYIGKRSVILDNGSEQFELKVWE